MKSHIFAALCAAGLVSLGKLQGEEEVVSVRLEPETVICQKFLGFGAEWDSNAYDDSGVTEADFAVVRKRVEWMRLPVARIMMQSKWCYKGNGRYDWNDPKLIALCRQLDVCQKLGATVVLTDWGIEQSWLATPEVGRTKDPKYAGIISTYMDHILNTKQYTCIKYFILINWSMARSKATLDAHYNQNGSAGGVCYLMTYTGGTPIPDQQSIYQDIPVSGLQSGMYTISARVRSQAGLGTMKLALQQLDSDGGCTVEIVAIKDVGEKNSNDGVKSTYSGPTDNSANASVVLSSTLVAARGPVTLRPNATFLRFLLLPQTANTFDVVDANVSRTGPISCQ